MSSKQYEVTIPTTMWVTVKVAIDDSHHDPEDAAINDAYEAVGRAVYTDCQGGISLRAPCTHLRYDDEFHNPWEGHNLDVVAVEDGDAE